MWCVWAWGWSSLRTDTFHGGMGTGHTYLVFCLFCFCPSSLPWTQTRYFSCNTTKRHTNDFGNLLLWDTRGKYHFQVCPQQFPNSVGHLSSRQSLVTVFFPWENWMKNTISVLSIIHSKVQCVILWSYDGFEINLFWNLQWNSLAIEFHQMSQKDSIQSLRSVNYLNHEKLILCL